MPNYIPLDVFSSNADLAWMLLLHAITQKGSIVHPRGIKCKEILAYTSKVDMTMPIVTTRPKLGYRFLAAEAWWILSGRNDVDSISAYSKHIGSFSNDGVHFDGAYGPRIADQLRYVVDALEKDTDTRQAVLEIWRPNPRDSKDVPCTVTVQWMIRDGHLHCFDTMRSSDAWLGWPYDVFNFSMLSAYILLLIKKRAWKNLKLGTLHLTAASQHLYVDPRTDGATNVPYSMKDIDIMFEKYQMQGGPPSVPYEPLDVDEFYSPSEFLKHLENCKDKLGTLNWMKEFQA